MKRSVILTKMIQDDTEEMYRAIMTRDIVKWDNTAAMNDAIPCDPRLITISSTLVEDIRYLLLRSRRADGAEWYMPFN